MTPLKIYPDKLSDITAGRDTSKDFNTKISSRIPPGLFQKISSCVALRIIRGFFLRIPPIIFSAIPLSTARISSGIYSGIPQGIFPEIPSGIPS